MKLRDFEIEVIQLADDGLRLTVANVAARLKLSTDKAEKWLDELAKAGKLDVEIDEDHGVVFYTVRGLDPRRSPRVGQDPGTALRLAELEADIEASPPPPRAMVPLPQRRQKSVLLAFVAAFFLPGIGLFYAAPIFSAVVATVACALLMKLAALPFVGWAIGVALALSSGAAGALYAKAFNRTGRRTEIVGRLLGRPQLPGEWR